MADNEYHLSDQDLLRAADGELSGKRAKEVRAHLAACWVCRTQFGEIEGAIQNFVRLYRGSLDPQLPPAAGPRAVLKAQLAAETTTHPPREWTRFLRFVLQRRFMEYASVALLMAVLTSALLSHHYQMRRSAPTISAFGAVPNRNLTPGATRTVSLADVCSTSHEEVERDVPGSLRQKVFQEYGIANPRPGDYEIDFLIAPRLGGAEDIHNLWPEPYALPEWNAHVKDALEERLHQRVCAGSLDLRTAQRDIATDWIEAYKKYFHTKTPLAKDRNRVDSSCYDCTISRPSVFFLRSMRRLRAHLDNTRPLTILRNYEFGIHTKA